MEIKKTKCDGCGKETDDHYKAVGWTQIGGLNIEVTVSISKGRRPDGQAKTGFYSGKPLDFCGRKCLIVWLDKLQKQKS